MKTDGMTEQGKVLAIQMQQPGFNPWNPCKSGRRELNSNNNNNNRYVKINQFKTA